eukprot:3759751-Prymnesium_polylepis.1
MLWAVGCRPGIASCQSMARYHPRPGGMLLGAPGVGRRARDSEGCAQTPPYHPAPTANTIPALPPSQA